jgi:hypothetical protein
MGHSHVVVRSVSELLRSTELRYDMADLLSLINYENLLLDIENRAEYRTVLDPNTRAGNTARSDEELSKEVKEWYDIILTHGPQDNTNTGTIHPFRAGFQKEYNAKVLPFGRQATLRHLRVAFGNVYKPLNNEILTCIQRYGPELFRYMLIQNFETPLLRHVASNGYKQTPHLRPLLDTERRTETRINERPNNSKAPTSAAMASATSNATTRPNDDQPRPSASTNDHKRKRSDPSIKETGPITTGEPPYPHFDVNKACRTCGNRPDSKYHNSSKGCPYHKHPQANHDDTQTWYDAKGKPNVGRPYC